MKVSLRNPGILSKFLILVFSSFFLWLFSVQRCEYTSESRYLCPPLNHSRGWNSGEAPLWHSEPKLKISSKSFICVNDIVVDINNATRMYIHIAEQKKARGKTKKKLNHSRGWNSREAPLWHSKPKFYEKFEIL